MSIVLPSLIGANKPARVLPPIANQYSVSFDGSDDRMTVGTGVNPTGSATLSFWFRRTGSVTGFGGTLIGTNNIFVYGYDNTFSINLKNGTDLTLESYNDQSGSYTNPVASNIINTNTWYHLALVLTFTDSSNSSGQFYLNGNTVGSAIALSGRTLAGLNEGFSVAMYPFNFGAGTYNCLLYTSPSPRDGLLSRMPSSA